MKPQFDNKTRFNWGYYEGLADIKHNRPQRYLPTTFHQDRPLPYWDKVYNKGYISAWHLEVKK